MEFLWERKLRAAGGVASAADLHALGLTDVDIRMFVSYERLLRVRRGWYALPDAHPIVVAACRLGGRVACHSALRLHGVPVEGHDDCLHIEVPANAVGRVPAEVRSSIRVHWARRRSPGDRGLVAAAAARAQALACRSCPQH